MTTDADQLKRDICEVGLRLYERGLVAGSDGNITTRLNEEQVLCTPTMLCKGQMKPEDICLVDMEGNQLAGSRQRTSEVLLHLEIMKARPDVESVIHCHAPHATAYAISGKPVPRFVMPESEFFFGEIPTAPYETPGTAVFARTILPYVETTNVCLLANHGTVSYANSLELAYNYTEILDAYCRILLLSAPLGPPETMSAEKCAELESMRIEARIAPPALCNSK